MTTHTPHDDVLTHGLATDCPRCAELAVRPWLLDADMQARLINGVTLSAVDVDAQKRLRAWAGYHAGAHLCLACGNALDPDAAYVVTARGWYHPNHYTEEVAT
jgi:hypothetical protein